ncbi:MAG TPA: AAA family ATPase [Candidatus Limnocylindrales bacterium]
MEATNYVAGSKPYVPSSPEEWAAITEEIFSGGPNLVTPPPFKSQGLPGWQTASQVQKADVAYLWEPYIVAGSLNLLVGDPGVGKSTLAVALAAAVSVGGVIMNGTDYVRAGHVLFVSSEDHESVIRGRLEAAGADMHRVHLPVQLPKNLVGELPAVVREYGASLVVIDPLMAFIKGDPYKDNEARAQFLTPLTGMAHESGATVLVLAHPNKTLRDNLIFQSAGSIGIVAAMRSALWLTIDPSDANQRVLAHFKSNYARLGQSVELAISDGPVLSYGGERPEHYRGAGLFDTQSSPKPGRITTPPRPDPIREAAKVARQYVEEHGETKVQTVIEHVEATTTGRVPESGAGRVRFLQEAGFKSKPHYGPQRGRDYSLWYLPDDEEAAKEERRN